jgi:hypothetical protein
LLTGGIIRPNYADDNFGARLARKDESFDLRNSIWKIVKPLPEGPDLVCRKGAMAAFANELAPRGLN